MQILIYLFYPGMIIVFGLVAMPEKRMRMEASFAVAGIGFLVGAILHYLSYSFKKRELD